MKSGAPGATTSKAESGPRLQRNLSLPLVVLYGLGTTIGAGIYALIGVVSGRAGMWSFASFGLASLLAMSTAASYAGLSSRYPVASAQAVFVREAFGKRRIATAVGLLVALSGSLSAATVTNGFSGYLGELLPIPHHFAVLGVVGLLAVVACLGVRQSVGLAGLVTAIEIGGLLVVLWFARTPLSDLPLRLGEFLEATPPVGWVGILGGSYLAFYAFLGFEDMVNIAEEVRDVRRRLPLAIALTLIVTLLLYVAVAVAAVLAVPPAELAADSAPLALVVERTGGDPRLLGTIGVLAMVNGALIQILMASRVLFGLARDGEIPQVLSRVHRRTRTPVIATLATVSFIAVLALFFPIEQLAESTSVFTLICFALVNASMIRLRSRGSAGSYDPPRVLPWIGLVTNLGFLVAWPFL